jgi:hypothetical protein
MTTTKIRFAFAILALACVGAANASTINWGPITAPDSKGFGDSFSWPALGDFSDRYNFTLTNEANSFGGLLEVDPRGSFLGIDVSSVALYKGFTLIGFDFTPGSFAFSDLTAGSYSFYVLGSISWFSGGFGDESVGYKGSIDFTPDGTTAVPEPSTLALAGIGLLGLAFAMRRRLFN